LNPKECKNICITIIIIIIQTDIHTLRIPISTAVRTLKSSLERYLKTSTFSFIVTSTAPPLVGPEERRRPIHALSVQQRERERERERESDHYVRRPGQFLSPHR